MVESMDADTGVTYSDKVAPFLPGTIKLRLWEQPIHRLDVFP